MLASWLKAVGLPARPDASIERSTPGETTSGYPPEDPGNDAVDERAAHSSADALIRRIDQAVGPDYEVVRLLGGGGMGIILLARDTSLDRVVAIKAIRPELATETAVQRFLREARILARIRHPNIIPVHRAGTADGLPWYAMEYVEGETLADRLERGPLNEREAITVGRALLDALAAAHAAGVIHRDVKPANIFLTAGRVLLGDFGVAHVDSRDPDAVSTSGTVGTPAYMAPEQAASGTATEQTDGYAAGMVIYEMLTGRRWVPTADPGQADWTGVKRHFRGPLRRALAWDPERRWNRASAFRRALSPRYQALRRATISGWVMAAVVVVAMVGWLWWTQRPAAAAGMTDLAIIPFDVQASDSTLGLDLADMVRVSLNELRQLRLTSDSKVQRWWRATEDAGSVEDAVACAALQALHCARASIERVGDSLRVKLRLVDAQGVTRFLPVLSWPAAEQLELANQISLQLLEQLWGDLVGSYLFPGTLPRDLEAVRLYLAGNRAFNDDAPKVAVTHYQAALERDQTFALARWGLVNAWRWDPGSTPDLRPHLEMLRDAAPDKLGSLDRMLVNAQLEWPGETRIEAYADAAAEFNYEEYPLLLRGEEIFHRGPLAGYPFDSAAANLEAATRLNGLLVPAYELLAWFYIRTGQQDSALSKLTALRTIFERRRSEAGDYAKWLEHAYQERFDPDEARLEHDSLFDPPGADQARKLAFAMRMGFAIDEPAIPMQLGARAIANWSSLRANGHYAMALAEAASGRGAAALEHLDEATDIVGTAGAALHAAQWRVLVPALGVPMFDETEREQGRVDLVRLADDESTAVRALWTLALDASLSGDDARAGPLRDRLAARDPDSTAVRLLGILDAQILAGRGRPDSALIASRPSLMYDAHERHGDPFARSALHLLRARWFEDLGRAADADRERLWAENLDIVGWPMDEPQAVEIDWILSVYASYLRGRKAGADPTRCEQRKRVVDFWRDAEGMIQPLHDETEARYQAECRT